MKRILLCWCFALVTTSLSASLTIDEAFSHAGLTKPMLSEPSIPEGLKTLTQPYYLPLSNKLIPITKIDLVTAVDITYSHIREVIDLQLDILKSKHRQAGVQQVVAYLTATRSQLLNLEKLSQPLSAVPMNSLSTEQLSQALKMISKDYEKHFPKLAHTIESYRRFIVRYKQNHEEGDLKILPQAKGYLTSLTPLLGESYQCVMSQYQTVNKHLTQLMYWLSDKRDQLETEEMALSEKYPMEKDYFGVPTKIIGLIYLKRGFIKLLDAWHNIVRYNVPDSVKIWTSAESASNNLLLLNHYFDFMHSSFKPVLKPSARKQLASLLKELDNDYVHIVQCIDKE